MSKRQEVMDLSKLITYGAMYRRFDEIVFTKTIESDLIKRWNRQNPGGIIDRKTSISETYLQTVLEKNKGLIQSIKQEMLRPIYERVKDSDELLPEEKNVQLFLGERYLNNLRPLTWFILSRFKDSDEYLELLNQIEITLGEFMEKSKIAEYLSLMIMELAINAENVNMQSFAKTRYKGTLDPMTVTYDPEIRKMLVEEMNDRKQYVYLSWKVGTDSKAIQARSKLSVKIYNKESGFTELKKNIDDSKNANIKQKSLMDFYKEGDDTAGNSELGLFYLSYLSEECSKVGIHFESLVNQIRENNLTVITLNLMI